MDKTTLDHYKAEEREKSNKLYRKLALLNIVHHPSEEFLKIFNNQMFLKPNDRAFFETFYYLFNILEDPAEIKKRFYWPITDKKYESMFRTATVAYINHLIEKFNLKWQPFKSYLVVKPGGMKFLIFLHDFIDFIVSELIKRDEKHLGIKKRCETFNLEKVKVQSLTLKSYAQRYAAELDLQKEEVENYTCQLKKAFTKLYALSGIPERVLWDSSFHSYFAKVNANFCKLKYNKNVEMNEFTKKLELLNDTIDEFNKSKTDAPDLKCMDEVFPVIKQMFPDINFTDNNILNLIVSFNKMSPIIDQSHQSIELQPKDMIEYENTELQRIRTETIQLETELSKFTTEYENATGLNNFETPKKSKNDGHQNVLQAKFMSTPLLRFSLDCARDIQLPHRMPFWDTSDISRRNTSHFPDNSIDSNDSFMNSNQKTAFQIPGTVKKNNSQSVSKKSKHLDPAQFLLSLKKDKSRSQMNTSLNTSVKNLSNLASKWKANSEHFLQPLGKKNQSIAKIQTTNEALLNLSTSPSGRFESIHNVDAMTIPKILLSEPTENSEADASDKTVSKEFTLNQSPQMDEVSHGSSNTDDLTITESDNTKVADVSLSNLCSAFQVQMLMENDDSIFNISDNVLNDVPDF